MQAMDTWDKFGCDPDGKLVRYDDDKHYIPYVRYEDMVQAVKHMPSAQPDIIHCGECRHFTTKGNIERVEFGNCQVTKGVCLREDYCSWAERKKGEVDDSSITD